ncbi:disease resistance protein RPP2B-like isoform X3 [Mercurialis annua]|uniref:disease resistance protein RPP2B-like isoform X3 n=1 Tax=Mercurialis annua TaxID=3986 RepID=UPI00215DF569|nr:disease resistance protein RPP2B-like isoform X3 [Mercurialis annua]
MKVIEGSRISVIVFSKGYASSPWCLDELVKILECREKMDQIVLPIFYLVDPSDAELGKGVFRYGLRKLEAKHKKSIDKWRNALKEATTLSGWDSKNHRPDSELIEAVVKVIVKKIYSASYSISADLVGLDTQIEQILSLFPSGPDDKPYFIGLWGMGGIGKTTIAEALFSLISSQFHGRCFLSNVREDSSKFGLIQLKQILLRELLGDKNLNIRMLHVLPTSVLERLKRNKVMIVLDDVNESAQLSSLIGDLKSWLNPGSRVIVTSRDKEVLQFCHKTYKGNVLDMHDLIQDTGREIAQREGSRLSNFKVICQMLTNNLANEAVQGIYLDLYEVTKVFLHPKAFSRMTNLRLLKFYKQNWDVQNFLESGLLEYHESKFLHYLPNTLNLLHWEGYPYKSLPSNFSMENLVELKITWCSITQLWDGDKSPQNLKRLDLSGCEQLMKLPNLSSAKNLEKIYIYFCESLIEIDSSIKFLYNLTHLFLYGCKKLKSLPEIPRSIEWLDLTISGMEKLSPSIPFLDGCVSLNLTGCRNIHELPEIAGDVLFLNLSQTAIEALPSSIISPTSSLIILIMEECENLKILPHSICELKYLEELNLSDCRNLCELPPLYGLSCLRKLCLNGTTLVEIPDDIVSLSSLRELNLNRCSRLQSLPKLPQQLIQLQVQNCRSLESAELSWYSPSIELSEYIEYLETEYDNLVTFKFNYCNCLNLDENSRSNILAEARFSLKEVAIAFNNSTENILDSYQFCIPGSEVPEWYKYESQGSSIATEFPPDCFNTPFFGFAFSVVLDQFSLGSYSSLSLKVECCFKNAVGVKHGCFSCCMPSYSNPIYYESDHVFLWYESNFDSDLNSWLMKSGINVINEASFEFSAFSGKKTDMEKLKVKKCGVHLIYEKDEAREDEPPAKRVKLMDFGLVSGTSSYFLEEAKETDTNDERSGENREEKLHHKGIKDFFSKLFSCFKFLM